MHIETLDLTDFRNYAELSLRLGPGRFVLAGDNAQGKSNLCEAIRLVATMRSFRAGSDRELVRFGAPGGFARVSAEVARAAGPVRVEIVVSAPPDPRHSSPAGDDEGTHLGSRKRVRVNGVPRRAIDCVGLVTVVLFEPTDLDLVIGPPQTRRHFLDVTLCQISRSYCRDLSHYQRVLIQRGALLRRIRDDQDDPRSLGYWDEQLAALAVPIITGRADLIARCAPPAGAIARRLGGADLRLDYRPSHLIAPGTPAHSAVEAMQARLGSLRRREIAQGVNLLGPHRDDLGFLSGDIDLAVYGSRGQQRTAALALKLAELDAIEAETGEQPVLVLDDVLSELDPARRIALLDSVGAMCQVILSTAEPDSLPPAFVASARVLTVRSGTIA